MNVAQLHQPADDLHATGAVGRRKRSQHHCGVAGIVLEVHVAHACREKQAKLNFKSIFKQPGVVYKTSGEAAPLPVSRSRLTML